MTTKDWRRTSLKSSDDFRIRWENKKNKRKIYIVSNEGFKSWSFGNWRDKNKIFKTKTQALTFAKAYMRKH